MTDNLDIFRQQRHEANLLADAGVPGKAADTIAHMRRSARSTREEIATEATRLAEHAARVAENARQGFTLNSLGEIQGRGMDLDRLCIRLQAEVEAATMALWPFQDEAASAGLTADLWPRD